MSPDEPWSAKAYLAMAAIAGAITSLSTKQWRDMGAPEIAMTLFVGASFAWFVTPLIAHGWLGVSEQNARYVAGLTYLFASGSNILLPFAIKHVKRLFSTDGDAK